MRRFSILSLVALTLFVLAAPALAEVGIQGGLSVDPDDVIFGLRWKGDQPIADAIYLVPSAEVGFGDATMVAGNLDAHYPIHLEKSKLAPYVGFGLTLNWFDWDGGSTTDFGGSLIGGIDLTSNIFFEMKLGLGDVPDWKFVVGLIRSGKSSD